MSILMVFLLNFIDDKMIGVLGSMSDNRDMFLKFFIS